MGKYSTYTRRSTPVSRKPELHPILRGIGFALIILIPIVSYAAAVELLKYTTSMGWITLTADMLVKKGDLLYPLVVNKTLPSSIYVILFLTLVIAVSLYALFSLFTFIIYRFFGPPMYSPYDVPPPRYKKRRKF